MAGDEFDIIRRHFSRQPVQRADVILGIGDDGAVLRVDPAAELVVCIDTLVAGVHFPLSTPPQAVGHKALAVNLSDLAAMGAEPAWATLALTLPQADTAWLDAFAQGFFALAARHGVALVGGDTTRGPLTITVQAHGLVPSGRALTRCGATPGDRVYVTGCLGDAALALQQADAAVAELRDRLDYPSPRLQAGLALRGLASAVIDVSDGLLADLGHLLAGAGLGATLDVDALPRSAAFRTALAAAAGAAAQDWYELPLSGGDDYELCCTVPPAHCAAVESAFSALECGLTAIGRIEQAAGIRCLRADGTRYQPQATGYNHFRNGMHE